MHAISCPLCLERRHSNLTKNRTCPRISVSWVRCCGWLVHHSLSSFPLSWRHLRQLMREGSQVYSNAIISFSCSTRWPHDLGLRRTTLKLTYVGVFLIVAVTKWGAPQIYVYLCCQCSEAGIKTSRNAQDSPALSQLNRPCCSDELTCNML